MDASRSLLVYDKPYDCPEKTNGTAERYRSYLGTAQSIGLPERTRWCQSERDCSRMPHRGRIFNVHFEPYGRKRPDRKKNAQWKPSYFSYFMTESKKYQKLVEEAFKKIEKTELYVFLKKSRSSLWKIFFAGSIEISQI